MRTIRALLAAAVVVGCAATSAAALEGSSAAGPIGGTDIRSAQLPPPGLYAGTIFLVAEANRFYDRNGDPIPALDALNLMKTRLAPFLLYVHDADVLGGHLGIAAIVPFGPECGRLFAFTPTRCSLGMADPYVEVGWSRYFGTRRPSQFADSYPVAEGLTLALGFGTVFPFGKYNVHDATVQGIPVGNNVWVLAPTAAVTYVTRPIIADGTEFSVRFYWNNYLINPDTDYQTGTLLDLDFAVTEKFGRLQVGWAGFYAWQVEDDRQFGVRLPPDGRRAEVLSMGPVVAYDIPEYAAFVKLKALASEISNNAVRSWGVALTFAKRL
jgi:hypothetical protein